MFAACLVNWWIGPAFVEDMSLAGDPFEEDEGGRSVYADDEAGLAFLPDRVVGYETMTVQRIPGMPGGAEEAVYKTMSMDITIARPTSVYARAERLSSPDAAIQRADDLVSAYTLDTGNVVLDDLATVRTRMAEDRSSYVMAWTNDDVVSFVKASFEDIPPAQETTYLQDLALPVAEAVDRFQRTGQDGVVRDDGVGSE